VVVRTAAALPLPLSTSPTPAPPPRPDPRRRHPALCRGAAPAPIPREDAPLATSRSYVPRSPSPTSAVPVRNPQPPALTPGPRESGPPHCPRPRIQSAAPLLSSSRFLRRPHLCWAGVKRSSSFVGKKSSSLDPFFAASDLVQTSLLSCVDTPIHQYTLLRICLINVSIPAKN